MTTTDAKAPLAIDDRENMQNLWDRSWKYSSLSTRPYDHHYYLAVGNFKIFLTEWLRYHTYDLKIGV